MLFDNLETAYKDKSNFDLNRAFFLFKSISNIHIAKILTTVLKFALFSKIPINYIIKNTIYRHFCGGTNIKESNDTIEKLWQSKIGTILDYSAEGKESENDFNKVLRETIKSLNQAKKDKRIPFSVFKPSGLTNFSLLKKINQNTILTSEEKKEKDKFIERIEIICQTATKNKVPVFIDAEESWIQTGIDNIALNMMRRFNKNGTYIFNTIQLYRTDRLEYIKELIETGKKENFYLGLKLVRGAYHEKEIDRAKKYNYKCPVYTRKEDSDNDFNLGLEICIKNIDIVSICAGTHNEISSTKLINLLKKYKIDKNDKRVYLSQLLGMSDNISYNAAIHGYNVAKYVPYGPVKDVIPYLIRRAQENTSISGQMGRELSNILKEKKRRKKFKNYKQD